MTIENNEPTSGSFQGKQETVTESHESVLTRKLSRKAVITWVAVIVFLLPVSLFGGIAVANHVKEQNVETRIGLVTTNYPVMSIERGEGEMVNIKVKGTGDTHSCQLLSEENLKKRATIFCEDNYRIEGTRPV